MLTRFLANSFAGILEILMWLIVLMGTLSAVSSEITGNPIFDAGIGFISSLIFSVIFFGPIMLIVDLKKSVNNIETILKNRS
ncbi:hypothetical protein HUF18_06675 [Thalassolituus sp. ST750PaO-4]|uniref:hypothetical protein n=1 Tax=Thalassolituus sp. ST750PaO-4 TaxID=2742965 RepID=UPI001CE330E4|nr:hypothetical protein [Thalassolituus sp. ST750PaO-4]MCA6059458.1 hypothetical protein [Thalassolituus sp. ST750PaO-4]